MQFVKAHGTGNDFVLLPDLDDRFELTAALTKALCAPHTGLGADGVIRVGAPRRSDAHAFMDYRNADGSIAEMCGNGVRCVAKYMVDRGLSGDDVNVETRAGVKSVRVTARNPDGRVQMLSVDMGVPTVGKVGWPALADGGDESDLTDALPSDLRITTVSLGNPHAVAVVDEVDGWPLQQLAARLNRHPEFPEGVNTEIITVVDRSTIKGRILERGVGETLASGSGASAMAVAAIVQDRTDAAVKVSLPGGVLAIDWSGERLLMEGPAVEVAHGTLDEQWLQDSS